MPVVQASPEIRELDVDQLRLDLRSIEANLTGSPWPETHKHQAESVLSGTTFARIVEILSPYQVEFEDGQYSVRAVGANHNLLDVKVNNQVSLAVFLSSGLINSPEIQDASFDGVVAVDVSSPYSGAAYPVGSRRRPANNLADAVLIADARGISEFDVRGDLTISGVDVAGYSFVGKNHHVTITVDASADTTDCAFENVTLQGELSGQAHVRDCFCIDVINVSGHITSSCLRGTITAAPGVLRVIDCWDGLAGAGAPALDFAGQATELLVRSYRGALTLRNKTGAEGASIDLMPGRVTLEPTVTSGTFIVKGLGPPVDDQSTGSVTLDETALVSPGSLAETVVVSKAHLAVAYDSDGGLLDMQVWAERGHIKVSPTAMQVDMYDTSGALVLSATQADAVLAADVYHVGDRPIVLAPLATYRVEVSVTDAVGTIVQTRSVVTTP
jgi:hypothetical protein